MSQVVSSSHNMSFSLLADQPTVKKDWYDAIDTICIHVQASFKAKQITMNVQWFLSWLKSTSMALHSNSLVCVDIQPYTLNIHYFYNVICPS